jgi:hypothetical protein
LRHLREFYPTDPLRTLACTIDLLIADQPRCAAVSTGNAITDESMSLSRCPIFRVAGSVLDDDTAGQNAKAPEVLNFRGLFHGCGGWIC